MFLHDGRAHVGSETIRHATMPVAPVAGVMSIGSCADAFSTRRDAGTPSHGTVCGPLSATTTFTVPVPSHTSTSSSSKPRIT